MFFLSLHEKTLVRSFFTKAKTSRKRPFLNLLKIDPNFEDAEIPLP
jgi:hypothetical protein